MTWPARSGPRRQENGVDIEEVLFTDHEGELIGEPVPECGTTTGDIPEEAQGIRAVATQTFDTFLMSVVGIDQLTARANATAIVGPITGSGVGLPVTFPQTMDLCDDSGDVWTIRDWNEENPGDGDANDNTGRRTRSFPPGRRWTRRTWPSSRCALPVQGRSAGWTSGAATSRTRSSTRATSS